MARKDAYDYQIKLLTIGNSGVGKTCLLLRYTSESFSGTFITTIGIDFKIKTVDINGKKVKLQIWDTAGQERFRTITQSYFRGAQGILLVFDVTDRTSFNNVRTWMESIDTHADKSVNRILIGNKCDMPERAVSRSEAEGLAKEYGVSYFEASAKKGIGVEEAFRNIAEQVVERLARDSTNLAAGRGGASGAKGGAGSAASGGAGSGGAVDIKDGGKAAGGGGGCCGK